MNAEQTIRKYLPKQEIMQLATESVGQPWCCSLHYVADGLNLYWLSWPERRHSRELARNPKTSIAIAISHENPVLGIQAEGRSHRVTDGREIQHAAGLYNSRFVKDAGWLSAFLAGENDGFAVYSFTPTKFVVFSRTSFMQPPERIEWQPQTD